MLETFWAVCAENTNLSFMLGKSKKEVKPGNTDGIPKTDDIKKAIKKNESKQEEEVVKWATVCCTSAETKDEIFILDSGGNAVELNCLSKLSRTDIKMSKEFTRCQYNNKICPKNKEIEGNEWQDYDELNGMGKGKEGLNKDTSYMVCLTGYGVIYFNNSGQEMKDFSVGFSTLNRYVNEGIFEKMGWNVNVFYDKYGNDAIETLKTYMYQYGITNQYSICMFLATIGAESGDGRALLEERYDFDNCFYTKRTKGAGLMQVTGADQKAFLEYIRSNSLLTDSQRNEINSIIDSYKWEDKTIYIGTDNEKTDKNCDNTYDVAEFIKENYPIESAVWYWAKNKKTAYYPDINNEEENIPMTLNEYVNLMSEIQLDYSGSSLNVREDYLGNLFIVTQYYVNGSPWTNRRLQKMAQSTDDSEYKIKNNEMTFTVPKGEPGVEPGPHHDSLPNSWEWRKEDWDELHEVMFG